MTTAPAPTDPATDPANDPVDPANDPANDPTDPPAETVESLKAALERQKAETRKQEKRAKDNASAARELETVRASTMSETEKAVAEAKAAGRTEALREASGKLVLAEMRAAAAGRSTDIDALADGVDPTRFLDADGDPDRDAIVAWVDKVAPAGTGSGRVPDLGQGARGGQQSTGDPARDFAQVINGQLKR